MRLPSKAVLAVLATFGLLSTATPALAATTVVLPGDLDAVCDSPDDACVFERDTGDVTIVDGGVPPLGKGYLQLSATTSNDKASVSFSALSGQPLSVLDDISYSTYRDPFSTGTAWLVPSINVGVDTNGAAAGGFVTLVWEPVYASGGAAAVQTGVWQRWTPSSGPGWWTNANQPLTPGVTGTLGFPSYTASLADVRAALPDAVIVTVGVNVGGGNPATVGGVDALTVEGTTYDFETAVAPPPPAPRPATTDDCKNGLWATYTSVVYKNQGDCVSSVARG